MGGQNQALWKECGIIGGKYAKTSNFCEHPCDVNRKLFFIPDTPHIMKSLRNHLTGHQLVTVPSSIVDELGFTCKEVKIEYIKQLFEIDSGNQLKLAPLLRESCLQPNHFEKMKVGLAIALLNHQTGAAIEYAVETNKISKDALTTAWFLKLMHRWFNVVASRTKCMALSREEGDDGETLAFLKKVRDIFTQIKIGGKGNWKPVQTGVVLATTTILYLHSLYSEKGFDFLLSSRLTQDSLENIFSCIRMKNPIPTPREFKKALRVITFSQFFQTSRSTSYENDDRVHLLNYMHLRSEDSMSGDLPFSSVNDEDEVEMEELGDDEANSLFYLTGRTVRQILPHISGCEKCKDAVEGGDELPDVSLLTELKDYTGSSLIKPSKSVFAVVKTAERCLRDQRESILKGVITHSRIVSLALEATGSSDLPTCHDVIGKLIKNYTRTRLHILVREFNSKLRAENSVKCGSRSIGMRMALHKL
ncbi:hypothetical protein J437_LFUL012513 [Ladona fulva]|uniref:Transposable element P transposase-like GTP-binding insertion domain-containing protein n=1 Tax=Ladona fulva TaxID=123851 RepID=A0A8K0NYI2_LADFU|nr:hypothetical protein J437_LFUL012513 [Ladona fulva]